MALEGAPRRLDDARGDGLSRRSVCGIAGILDWGKAPDPGLVRAMSARLAHRGPDADGLTTDGPVALGHRRLAVIDLGPANNQPFADPDRSYLLVFNGEIYNYGEIRRELIAAGARFRTQGDTEVVLEAYRQWSTACLHRFNGMFAFALWDRPRRRLFLARDRLGEKPLFYAETRGGGLVFASEPRALALHPELRSEVDPIGLAHYLTLNYSLGERTLRRGVRRLPAGHYLLAEPDKPPAVHRFWDLAKSFRNKRRFASKGEAAEELRALVDDAVRLRLVSDVPLGAFLSGGVDSSAVVEAMARAQPTGGVHTFSMGFGVPTYDEVDAARAVAMHLGVDHRERIAAAEPAETIMALGAAADEPLADTSAIPTYLLARFAREHVTVALSGDGADECLLGYETYLADRLHRRLAWLPRALIRVASHAADRLLPVRHTKVSLDYKVRQFLAELHRPFPQAHASWRNIFSTEERHALMQPWWRELAVTDEADPVNEVMRHFVEVAGCHYLDQASYVDIKTWLADDILVKVDRATMAHSLEARPALLDHRLVELAASLPADWKLSGWRTKALFKRALRPRLPSWVLTGKKQGFNAPVTPWLAGPLRPFAEEVLASQALHEWIRPAAIARLWQEQDAGRRDNGLRLFGLVSLALWLNQS